MTSLLHFSDARSEVISSESIQDDVVSLDKSGQDLDGNLHLEDQQ